VRFGEDERNVLFVPPILRDHFFSDFLFRLLRYFFEDLLGVTLHEMVEEFLLIAGEVAELVVLHDAAVVGLVGAGEEVTLEIAALCLEPATKGAIHR